jgi:enoyl-CoA hydratase/carnithine racemase
MADDELVLYDQQGPVAVLTLNRPDRLNAWNDALGRRYLDLLDQCADDPSVRAIVVTGAGRGFCAGADFDVLQGIQGSGGEPMRQSGPPRPTWHALTIPKPIVAAINGPCAGLGLIHALMLDVRFAAAGAKFTTAFARRGLVAEYGASWILPRLIGPARALDLLLSARPFLAEEAYEMGVVNKVVRSDLLLAETIAYATELATMSSPSSMAAIKRQVWRDLTQSLEASDQDAEALMKASLKGPDFDEGVASFLEKRAPHFAPLRRGWATGE